MTSPTITKGKLTRKQKKILWQALVDHVIEKKMKQDMIYGVSLFHVPYQKFLTKKDPLLD